MPTLTDAALDLARAGWSVFPVSVDQKRPRTRHGHLDATKDASTIENWRRLFDQGGAIATPTGNGLLVIDVDPRNGGELPRWAPPTLTVTTQHQGWHLYYKLEGDDIKSRASLFGPGIDSKCAGGYVLVPPSPGYRWSSIRPRAILSAEELRSHFDNSYTSSETAARIPPEEWHRGIIHDQVMAWGAYFAGTLQPDDVPTAVWAMVDQARATGLQIDNARDHIGSAIRWIMAREASTTLNPTNMVPDLS